MACALHLSFLVLVFSLIMVWIVCPSVGCESGEGRREECLKLVRYEGLSVVQGGGGSCVLRVVE